MRCAETEETNDFNWLDPAWSQQEVGKSAPRDTWGAYHMATSPGWWNRQAMLWWIIIYVVLCPGSKVAKVDVRCKMERWRSRMCRRRLKTTGFLMSLYIFVDPYSRPYRPKCFAWHRKRLERQAISAVANHWQFHMAYHAGQRMRAQVIMMVFRMLGESLASYWLFMAFDSLDFSGTSTWTVHCSFQSFTLKRVGAVFPLVNTCSRNWTQAAWFFVPQHIPFKHRSVFCGRLFNVSCLLCVAPPWRWRLEKLEGYKWYKWLYNCTILIHFDWLHHITSYLPKGLLLVMISIGITMVFWEKYGRNHQLHQLQGKLWELILKQGKGGCSANGVVFDILTEKNNGSGKYWFLGPF